MTKLLLFGGKMLVGGSIGMLLLLAAPLGLPLGSTWFDGFIWGIGTYVFLGAAVSSMIEPDQDSSKLYIFVFRFGHVLMNRATIYFAHRSFWRLFVKAKDGAEEPQRRELEG